MIAERQLLHRLQSTRALPTLPTVLLPLLRYLERPLDSQDVHEIVRLVAQDESLAAQCLQVANSPLYGASHEVHSIQAAVVSLGLQKIHEIAVSCSILKLLPRRDLEIRPSVFWAHSLACALIAREFASAIGFAPAAKAYAAGLLHDIGIIGFLTAAPKDFERALRLARSNRIPLHEAEAEVLGMTHAAAGKVLGQQWRLPAEIVDVIAGHHHPSETAGNAVLTSIVYISDLLCRFNDIGHGHGEDRQANLAEDPALMFLKTHFAALQPFDWARFTFAMAGLVEEVQGTVREIYGAPE